MSRLRDGRNRGHVGDTAIWGRGGWAGRERGVWKAGRVGSNFIICTANRGLSQKHGSPRAYTVAGGLDVRRPKLLYFKAGRRGWREIVGWEILTGEPPGVALEDGWRSGDIA